jgi:hypothetical protein
VSAEVHHTPQGYVVTHADGAVRIVRHMDGLGLVTLDLSRTELAVIRGEDVAPLSPEVLGRKRTPRR